MEAKFFLMLTKLVPHSGLTSPGEPAPQLVKVGDQQYKPEPLNIVISGAQVEALMSIIHQVSAQMQEKMHSAQLKQALAINGNPEPPLEVVEPE